MGPACQPDLVVFERDHARKIKLMRIHTTDEHGVLHNKPKVRTKFVTLSAVRPVPHLDTWCCLVCAKSSTHLELSHVQ